MPSAPCIDRHCAICTAQITFCKDNGLPIPEDLLPKEKTKVGSTVVDSLPWVTSSRSASRPYLSLNDPLKWGNLWAGCGPLGSRVDFGVCLWSGCAMQGRSRLRCQHWLALTGQHSLARSGKQGVNISRAACALQKKKKADGEGKKKKK